MLAIATESPQPRGCARKPGEDLQCKARAGGNTQTLLEVARPGSNPSQATYYNYDIDGNVKTLWQQIGGLSTAANLATLKRIDYEYDLVSGKVNFVRYQDGQPDRFYYNYKYDAENRLTEAWSGPDALVDAYNGSFLYEYSRRRNAAYYYYLHGPLARTELGDEPALVQGMDYAYTLQGWLKGVNGATLGTDMWKDGRTGGYKRSALVTDAYAYSLGYYTGDYSPIGGGNAPAFAQQYQGQITDPTGQSLYNGNISNTTLAISTINTGTPVGYTYRYDQLNRLKKMRQHSGIGTSNWNTGSITSDYAEDVTYDGNGNIQSYNRNGNTVNGSNEMDQLHYGYIVDQVTQKLTTNNRLYYVNDDKNTTSYNGADLPYLHTDINQPNYTYDAIGNLTGDAQAGISNIEWTVYGKIKNIYKSSGNINYSYSPSGQRVSKTAGGLTTWYVRDAQGNTMGVYDNAGSAINWREQHLYGSSRLGLWTPNVNQATANAADDEWKNVGHINYELGNHLGNVLATITDKRVQNLTGSSPNYTLDHFEADVATAQDYYPFGMLMPGRQFTANGTNYRYGFNGKENDNEIVGVDDWQDYGDRIYSKRIGRFASVDQSTKKYPYLTPYQFASNTPISAIDIDGREAGLYQNGAIGASGTPLSNYFSNSKGRENWDKAMGIGIGGGVIVLADIYLTKGKLSQLFLYSTAFSALQDNAAKTAAGRAKQNKDGLNYVASAGMMYLTGAILGRVFKLAAPLFKPGAAVEPIVKNPVLEEPEVIQQQVQQQQANAGAARTINSNYLVLTHPESTITKSSAYQKIMKLSDQELIESVVNPTEYDPVTINTRTGKLVDGNTRIYEIQRRGLNVNVPVERYTPDNSAFDDFYLKEPPKKP